MTTTRPKRVTRNATPAPPIEDDTTIVRTTLDRVIYTVDVMARFDQTRADIMAVNRGESEKTMEQVMTETRWHEHASKARKEFPLGSSKKKRQYEEEEEEEEDNEGDDAPCTSKPPKTPKPTPEKKSTPSKAKLAAMKKKADAARRKAQREAKKLAELEEKEEEDDEDQEESFVGMPLLENSTLSPPVLSPNPPSEQIPVFFDDSADILTSKPWLADSVTLYPLDLVTVSEDIPGRVWCPPRGLCQATGEQVVEIGPLTELETLDLSLCPESFARLLPEKADLIIRRMLELQIPYLEMKLLDPEMTDEDRELNIKQLEVYEKQLDENMDKEAILRLKVLGLPGPPMPSVPRYQESIEYYTEFDPTWYSSSRIWFDKAIRKSGEVTQQDFLDQFEETDDQMILAFQREMLEKAKEAEEQRAAEKVKEFKLPLLHSLDKFSPVLQERILAFRDKLAHIYQYENFEEVHMSDPACRGIWKKLQPLPYENGAQADESEEELLALISTYKVQFAKENPVIPLPEPLDDENETSSEIEAATKRFLSDVIDTVVLRDMTDLPFYPHRIPLSKNQTSQDQSSSQNPSAINSRDSSSDRTSPTPTQSE